MSKTSEAALKEVTERIRKISKGYSGSKKDYYNSALPMLAKIPVPVQRKQLQAGYSFSELAHEKQRQIWHYIWKEAEYFEVCSQAIFYFESRKKDISLEDWKLLKQWVQKLDNWAHSDGLSGIYSAIHEKHPDVLYPVFKTWNAAKDPWRRRQSIVSLYYYSSLRKTYQAPYAKSIPLVSALLQDEHYYVQKGVGWTLRELYNLYPEKVIRFLHTHVQDIHPHAWQAATEKLDDSVKQVLKEKRSIKKTP